MKHGLKQRSKSPSKLVISLILVGLWVAFSAPRVSEAQTYKIVGYLPSWQGSVNSAQIDKLTHINYAFLLPNSDGSLRAIENPSKLQQLVSTAHSKSKKVLISVGGWNDGNDSSFESIAASATYRSNFATNLYNFMNLYGLDGIDIDWEYPEAGDNYYELISAIRNRIGSGKLLTAAVASGSFGGDGVTSSAINVMDYITLMAYDGNSGAGHSPYSLAESALNYWGGKTSTKSKLILGVPFYSRPGWYAYNTLRAGGCSADSDTCSYGGTTQYYNGRPTMRAKVDLMKSKGGGGIMIWDLSQDTAPTNSDSLLKTIYDRLSGGSSSVCDGRYYKLLARHSGKAAVVQSASTADGANIFQWTYGGSATNDEWQLIDIGSGYCRVMNRNSGKAMVVQSASTADGANVFQWTYGGSATNDEWQFVDLGTGYYRIVNRNSGKVLEVVGAGTTDGTNIDQRTSNGGTNQQWQVVNVP